MQILQKALMTVLLLLFCASISSAQQEAISTVTIIQKPRVLSRALKELAHQNSWLLAYEDESYDFDGDVVDTGKSRVERSSGKAIRLIDPKPHSISMTYRKSEAPNVVAQRLADVYNRHGAGKFIVKEIAGRIVVMPGSVRDRSGNLVTAANLLDKQISLPEMERSAAETFQEICKAIGRSANATVHPGTAPIGASVRSTMRFSALNEPAREVLVRFLDQFDRTRRMVWTLNKVPREDEYALNLDYVAEKADAPTATLPMKQ